MRRRLLIVFAGAAVALLAVAEAGAWKAFAYQGDVHGVRFPGVGPADGPWNVYGGYAPQEMVEPGKGS